MTTVDASVTTSVTLAIGSELDIDVAQGATFTLMVTVTTGTDNTPYALTGYRAHMQVRRRAGTTGTPILDCSTTNVPPEIILEPLDTNSQPQTGVLIVRIPATKTILLKKNGVYDLFLVDENDVTEAIRLVYGRVTVSESATVN